jgi:hypothetical protein
MSDPTKPRADDQAFSLGKIVADPDHHDRMRLVRPIAIGEVIKGFEGCRAWLDWDEAEIARELAPWPLPPRSRP